MEFSKQLGMEDLEKNTKKDLEDTRSRGSGYKSEMQWMGKNHRGRRIVVRDGDVWFSEYSMSSPAAAPALL